MGKKKSEIKVGTHIKIVADVHGWHLAAQRTKEYDYFTKNEDGSFELVKEPIGSLVFKVQNVESRVDTGDALVIPGLYYYPRNNKNEDRTYDLINTNKLIGLARFTKEELCIVHPEEELKKCDLNVRPIVIT